MSNLFCWWLKFCVFSTDILTYLHLNNILCTTQINLHRYITFDRHVINCVLPVTKPATCCLWIGSSLKERAIWSWTYWVHNWFVFCQRREEVNLAIVPGHHYLPDTWSNWGKTLSVSGRFVVIKQASACCIHLKCISLADAQHEYFKGPLCLFAITTWPDYKDFWTLSSVCFVVILKVIMYLSLNLWLIFGVIKET